jgi:hypothetical protein
MDSYVRGSVSSKKGQEHRHMKKLHGTETGYDLIKE